METLSQEKDLTRPVTHLELLELIEPLQRGLDEHGVYLGDLTSRTDSLERQRGVQNPRPPMSDADDGDDALWSI